MEPDQKRVHIHARKSTKARSTYDFRFRNLHYEERLKKLEMQSLEERRRRGDLIQCYKVMNGHGDIDPDTWFSFVRARHDMNTRTHAADHILLEKCQRNVRKNFYTNRVAKDWNELPFEVKNARSTNAFKNLYDSWHRS